MVLRVGVEGVGDVGRVCGRENRLSSWLGEGVDSSSESWISSTSAKERTDGADCLASDRETAGLALAFEGEADGLTFDFIVNLDDLLVWACFALVVVA